MENSIMSFVQQISHKNEEENAKKSRQEFFRSIGKKGGLAKKNAQLFTVAVSTRLTENEYQMLAWEAEKYGLKLARLIRLKVTGTELKVNEFETDAVLLNYGNNFTRITNLLRNREWSEFENKRQILEEIEAVTQLLKDYLFQKLHGSE